MINRVLIPPGIDVNGITYLPPESLPSGGRIVHMLYDGEPLLIQTPYMTAPDGVSKWPRVGGNPAAEDRYSIELSFEGLDTSIPLRSFYDMLQNIGRRVVDDAILHSAVQSWPNRIGHPTGSH